MKDPGIAICSAIRGSEWRGETWCLGKMISTERTADRTTCPYHEHLMNGKNVEACQMRGVAGGEAGMGALQSEQTQ